MSKQSFWPQLIVAVSNFFSLLFKSRQADERVKQEIIMLEKRKDHLIAKKRKLERAGRKQTNEDKKLQIMDSLAIVIDELSRVRTKLAQYACWR